jgi:hypothetical protein
MARSCSFMFVVHNYNLPCDSFQVKWPLKLMKSQYGRVSMLKYGWWGWRGDFIFFMQLLQSGERNDIVLFWWRNTMLVVGLGFVRSGVEFWVCCNFWDLLKVFIWDLGNLMNQHLCFEKPRHIKGIWWKVKKPCMTNHNMKLRFKIFTSIFPPFPYIFEMCFFHLFHLLCQMFLKGCCSSYF